MRVAISRAIAHITSKSTVIALIMLASPSIAMAEDGIVASIKPLHSLVSAIIGDTAEAQLIVDSADTPHGFQLRPSQQRAIQQASIIFYIDPSLEAFMQKALAATKDSTTKVAVAKEAKLNLLPLRTGAVWAEEDDHHGHNHGHHHDDHAAYDTHVWLDINNAKLMATLIAQELGKVYPENKGTYTTNLAKLIIELEQLDQEIAATMQAHQSKPFVVLHDALQYFEHAYSLSVAGAISVQPEIPPSANRLVQIRNKIKQSNAHCVFSEPQNSQRVIDTITKDSNINSGTIDPLGIELPAGANLYSKLMGNMATTISQCLGSADL